MLFNPILALSDILSSQSTWVHCRDLSAQLDCKSKTKLHIRALKLILPPLQIGGLVINSVARGTGSNKDNSAWRIPFGLFYVVPVIVASLIWFVPEVRLFDIILGLTIHTDQIHQTHSRLAGWP